MEKNTKNSIFVLKSIGIWLVVFIGLGLTGFFESDVRPVPFDPSPIMYTALFFIFISGKVALTYETIVAKIGAFIITSVSITIILFFLTNMYISLTR